MKDNFSRQADAYARYRPGYPQELFDFILSYVSNRTTAWDCATGNGQTAKVLAKHFEKVWATDISETQLLNATRLPNIFYSVQPAEQTDFPDSSIDLVTVSQALHWLDIEQFYAEVKRVARPGAWLAAWMYNLPAIAAGIDELIAGKLYKEILGSYWDKERKKVDEQYSAIPFPFAEIGCPSFLIRLEWTLGELSGYLNTWSALQKFIAVNQYNPADAIAEQIRPLWQGDKMNVLFPVTLRMGRIEK